MVLCHLYQRVDDLSLETEMRDAAKDYPSDQLDQGRRFGVVVGPLRGIAQIYQQLVVVNTSLC